MQTAASDIGKSVLTELECPVCKQYMMPPITICLRGHNICNTCRPTVSSCPTCRQSFLLIRNVSLENLSLQMKFLCRYSEYGCRDTFLYNAIREHEAICGYSPQKCPVDYLRLRMICTWNGISKDLKTHLQTAHEDLCQEYNAHHLFIPPRCDYPCYINKFLFPYDEIFFYRLLIERGIMHLFLHYIGPAENDSKYQYKVIVRNRESTERVEVTHLARSFTETEDDRLFPRNCLKLHCDHIERFRNEECALLFSMEILSVGD